MKAGRATSARSSPMLSACAEKFLADVGEDVDADHVGEAEGAGAGPAEGGAGEGVDLFDGQALRHHQADGVHHGEGADAVGDEVGRVVRVDDGLAEALVAEVRDGAMSAGSVSGVGMISSRRM